VAAALAAAWTRPEDTRDDVHDPEDLAPAALIESPLYREGMALQPWQQGFVTECLKHHHDHGQVRLLLADDVGLGGLPSRVGEGRRPDPNQHPCRERPDLGVEASPPVPVRCRRVLPRFYRFLVVGCLDG
jgi:hypothetical protein